MNAHLLRCAAIVLSIMLLPACVSKQALLGTDGQIDAGSEGVLLMSLGFTNEAPPYQAYWIRLKPVSGNNDEVRLFSSPNNIFNSGERTLRSPDAASNLIALAVPQGDYQIDKLGAFTDMGPYSAKGMDRPPLVQSIITISNGKITYLGSAVLSRSTEGEPVYIVHDELERDMALLRKLRPDIARLEVNTSLLQSEWP